MRTTHKTNLFKILSLFIVAGLGETTLAAEFFGLGNFDSFDVEIIVNRWHPMSSDGNVVVWAERNSENSRAFRWTPETGVQDIGEYFTALVSPDGNVVFGDTLVDRLGAGGRRDLFRWTNADGWIQLGNIYDFTPTESSNVPFQTDINFDGSIVVGNATSGILNEVTRFSWSDLTGFVELDAAIKTTDPSYRSTAPLISTNGHAVVYGTNDAHRLSGDETIHLWADGHATGVSFDGSIVVGVGNERNEKRERELMYWTDADGLVPTGLTSGAAPILSEDGGLVVGGEDTDDGYQLYTWNPAIGRRNLDAPSALPNTDFVQRLYSSYDGSVIAGKTSAGGDDIFLWREDLGVSTLRQVLEEDFGLVEDTMNWTFDSLNGISEDGTKILGYGVNPAGSREMWMAILDAPLRGDFDGNRILGASDIDLMSEALRIGSSDAAFDLNGDQMVDTLDRATLVSDVFQTYFGDSNLDGEFNSRDFVLVFQSGQYEDDLPLNSTWESGDWDGDGDFTTTDLVFTFQDGGYERGPRQLAFMAVPESLGSTPTLFGLALLMLIRRKRRVD